MFHQAGAVELPKEGEGNPLMRSIKGRRPSPAMVVALVALVGAFAGESIADVATKALTKKEKKQTKKIARNKANQQIDERAPGLSVANANTANSANTANTANTASTANTAITAGSADSVVDNAIGSDQVLDNGLNAVDVSTVTGAATLNFGNVAAGSCVVLTIDTGVNIEDDVIVVSVDDTGAYANGGLTVHAADSNVPETIRVVACNVTNAGINPVAATFSYVIFRR